MSQENKTEKATPHRRRKLRQEGNVAKSPEIASSLTVLISSIIIFFTGAFIFREVIYYLSNISQITPGSFQLTVQEVIRNSFMGITKLLVPLFITTLLIVVLSHVAQFGFIFTLKPLQFKPNRINPVEGIKKMLSLTTLFELVKNSLKVVFLLGVALFILKGSVELLVSSSQLPIRESLQTFLNLLFRVVLVLGVVAFFIALLDLAYKKWDYEKRIRMSKQEVKEEYKQLEGNPQIKAKLKSRMREIARGRMMAEVPKASVVITNPTHIAIALKYDPERDSAPKVVAKGKGDIAKRIVQIAQENDIPVLERQELARALYPAVEVGEEIPPKFYRAIAEIIAFVMFRRKRAYV